MACLLRPAGPPIPVADFSGVQIHDARLREVLAPSARLHCLYDQTVHGEGPAWDHACDRLVWSDVAGRRLLGWHPDGHVEVVLDATPFINGNAFDATGRLFHCEHLHRCISRSADQGDLDVLVTHFEGRRLNSPNDIAVASDGALWFTDPTFGLIVPQQGCLAEPELDHRSVYRFDLRAGELRRMADFVQPNGLAFSPDGLILYVSDTARALDAVDGDTHEILAFDIAHGQLTNRRLFCRTDVGVPDGFAIDGRGWLWTTAGDGIHVHATDGHPLGFVPTPETTCNCTFGHADGRRLFIAAETSLYAIDLL